MEKEIIYFSKDLTPYRLLVGKFSTRIEETPEASFQGYIVESERKELTVRKARGGLFSYLVESEIENLLLQTNTREKEREYKRVQKLYLKIRAKIKYFLNSRA